MGTCDPTTYSRMVCVLGHTTLIHVYSFAQPEIRNPNPESRIPNPEPRIPNPESQIPNPETDLWIARLFADARGFRKTDANSKIIFQYPLGKFCSFSLFVANHRKVDVRLSGKWNSNSHGARPVHLIIKMIE